MTYFDFLLRFVAIPLLILVALTAWDRYRGRQAHGMIGERAILIGIVVHVLVAVIYTTPWDNYLVATGVWTYNPHLVTGIVLGYVPIEEYTFFVLEALLVSLWWWFLARRLPPSETILRPSLHVRLFAFLALFLLWVLAVYLFFFGNSSWTYLSLILAWALPAMFPQMLFGADLLWNHRHLVVASILVPGLYLSLMDIVALTETTWSISPHHTTGLVFFDILPLEEGVFFFVTSTLITFGLTLSLSQQGQARFQTWKSHGYRGWP